MYRFKLPDIGEGIVEAEVLAWRVREGDWVHEDQIVADILTDKAEVEIPAPVAGRVHSLNFAAGDLAPVGAVLIEIDDEAKAGEAPSAHAEEPATAIDPARPAAAPLEAPPAPIAPADDVASAPRSGPPPRPSRPRPRERPSTPPVTSSDAVPAVRDLARRLGIDIADLRGTGPRGRIMRRDVEAAAAEHAAAPAPESRDIAPAAAADEAGWKRVPLRGLRRTIARRMVHARHTAAHFTYVEEVDLTDLLDATATAGFAGSPLPFIAHASVRALANQPTLNASIDDARDEIILKPDVHLGIAVATEEGLLVPVLRDAKRFSAAELRDGIAELARRARDGSLRPEELRGSTFTLTSLGKLGGLVSTPIVNHPEVAILGVNRVRDTPAFEGDQLVKRRMLNLSISVDHRIADGLVAARFIADMKSILEAVDFEELAGTRRQSQS